MTSPWQAVLESWSFDPWMIGAIAAVCALYTRGWAKLRRRGNERFDGWRLAAMAGALVLLFLAVASPIDSLAGLLLQAHMVQHLLLTMAIPVLVWLSEPELPLLAGMPRWLRREWVTPIAQWPPVRSLVALLTHPLPAWLLFVLSMFLWHTPVAYDLALKNSALHEVEHACFLGTALLFWRPVIAPFPSHFSWSRWWMVPYLLLADIANTMLSALLAFAERPIYVHYATAPRLWGISATTDQAAAGAIMWVPGSLFFLVPMVGIGIGLAFGGQATPPSRNRVRFRPATPHSTGPIDLLHMSIVGPILRARSSRWMLQALLLALAAIIAWDGWTGPELAPMNLAGVVPWIHWRGLAVIGLLLAGNVVCYACPFMLPRTVGRAWLPAAWAWPKALRSKWLAVGLVGLFLWSYEAFSLWDSPWLTAWIIAAYFAAALLVDGFFRNASFCKYVCPLGQFNFLFSTLSPWEVRTRSDAVCSTCSTKDCIRGNATSPGCELLLFQPHKVGNLDCTMCLDCVTACPHDNIGVILRLPIVELVDENRRSGIGRLGRRLDYAILALIFTFGGFVNAAAMTEPAAQLRKLFERSLPAFDPQFALATAAIVAIAFAVVVHFLFARLSLFCGGTSERRFEAVASFAFALVPLGASVWIAHYSFHFLSSLGAIVPAIQRWAADVGLNLGTPAWNAGCFGMAADSLLKLEILILDIGLLGSLYCVHRLVGSRTTSWQKGLGMFIPWLMLLSILWSVALWLNFQPMQMRGAVLMNG